MRAADIITNREYILYVNGKPASKYSDEHLALADMRMLAKSHPNRHFEIRAEVCRERTIHSN